MNSARTLRSIALKASLAGLMGWSVSCADNAAVAPRQSRLSDEDATANTSTSTTTTTKAPEKTKTVTKDKPEETEPPKKKKGSSGFSRTDGTGSAADIEFPQFRFNGEGRGPCGGKQYPVVMNVTTTYSEDSLEVRKENSNVICSDKYFKDGYPDNECNKRANSPEKRAKRDVTNTFIRLTAEETKQAKADGVDLVTYAIFSKEIRVSDGRVFTLSKPVPVGIVPAAEGRYKSISTKSWQASVSGGAAPFDVVIEISKVSSGGGTVELKMTSTIPQAGDNWSMYDGWVLPTEAIYTVDTEDLSIKSINSKSKQSGGGDKCNTYEESSMTLTLCEKIQGGDTTAGSCTFGNNPYP